MKTFYFQLIRKNNSILRMFCLTGISLLALLLNAPDAFSQKPIDSLNFATDGEVNASLIHGNFLYLGGNFDWIGEKTGPVAFFNHGSSAPDAKKPLFGSVRGYFTSDQVYAVLSDGNGGWFVGGNFDKVNNQSHILLVHILSDNTLDPKLNINWKSDQKVNVIKKDDNYLYVGGQFIAIDNSGAEHRNIFRFNLSTYNIDPDWNPPIIVSDRVEKIEIGNDKIFLAGWIGKVGDVQQDAMIVVDKIKGSRIPFPTTSSVTAMHLVGDTLLLAEPDMYWSKYTDGFGYIAKGLAMLDATNDIPAHTGAAANFYASIPDGKGGWYAVGRYYDFGDYGVYHLDKDFKPYANFTQHTLKSFTNNTCLFLDGNSLFVSTSDGHSNPVDAGNGNLVKYLFKLDATTGEFDPNFKPNPNDIVRTMLVKDGILYVGGDFDSIAGDERSSIAAINSTTGDLQSWDPVVNLTNFNAGYTGGVRYISDLKLTNDTLYAAGAFQMPSDSLSGVRRGIYGLARFNLSTGSLDTTFHISTSYYDHTIITGMARMNNKLYVVGSFELNKQTASVKNVGVVNLGTGMLQSVNADLLFTLANNYSYGSQRITEFNGNLYIWGVNTKQISNGATRSYLVSLNAENDTLNQWNPAPNWSVYTLSFSGGNILLSGGFYFLKHYPNDMGGININTKQYIKFPDLYTVYSIVSNDKYIYFGGDFTRYSDSLVNGLFRLRRSDLSLTKFDHQIKSDNGRATISMLALGTDGLFAVGLHYKTFNLVAGVPRQNICLLDPETAHLKTWNPPQFNGKAYRVFTSGSDVAMSGTFGLMPAWNRTSLAKINLISGKVDNWNPVLSGFFPNVYALSFSRDTIFVGGGGISKVNAENAGNLCALDAASGSLLAGFVPPTLNGDVSSLSRNGAFIYAGGSFETVNSVTHNYVAKFNSQTGAAETWDPQLSSWNVKSLLATDSSVYIGGFYLQITGNAAIGSLLRVDPVSGALIKVYPAPAGIFILTQNKQGEIAAGAHTEKGLLLLDKAKDTLVTANMQQEFYKGVSVVKSIGDLFLVAGNGIKEFGSYTSKPGFLVYDPIVDTVITSFSMPLIDGSIETFAADEKTLVMAGDFAGMNSQLKNADLAFMKTPDLHLQPGVSSWSPTIANNVDPFAVSVYGSGFTQSSKVSLSLSNTTLLPDSIEINNQKILAYFNGTNFTSGDWDLEVEITSGNTLLFSKALKIEQGDFTDVWVKWSGPNRFLARRPTTNYITFGNRGNRDAYGIMLYVAVGEDQTVVFPDNITHPNVKFEVDWDTISNYVDVDYFLGEPFHGKVYTLFIPYLPQNYEGAMKLRLKSEDGRHEIRVAISKPIYQNYEQLYENLKSTKGMAYNFFSCMYAVAGLVADLTPGLGCAKAAFDNTVLMAVDKYQKNESIKVEDVANSIGLTAIGCVPGEAQLSAAFKIAKGMAGMYAGASDAGGAMSACGGFAGDCSKMFLDMVAYSSHDPNAKYGPAGRGSSIYVPTHLSYQYMVTFENDSTATAPAQRVIVTDTLDKNVFDITSFNPIGFGFGDTTYFYKKTDGDTVDIDMRPDKQIIVRVFYSLNTDNGILTWTFQTLDPNTYELVEGVDDGFLPPNKKSPEGEGNVLYSVQPLSGLAEGTKINNSAHIVFDWNESIPTNDWRNVADNTAPESAVKALPAKTVDKDFTVNWHGNDVGSGIFSYTVYVADNDSAYYPWLLDTHDTTAVFSGQPGSTYKFYTVATDSAGNKEIAPAIYDAITQVSGTGIDKFGTGDKMEFRVYPNPSQGKITMDYYLPENSRVRLDVLNLCGHLVMDPYEIAKSSGKQKIRFDLSNLPAGYYFVRILTKYGVQTRKLVIQ